jgi:hypothetical protein
MVEPLLLEDVEEGEVAAVRDEYIGLHKDKAAEQSTMILHLLVENVPKHVVFVHHA